MYSSADTDSADDSAGKTWGLEGSLFWFLTGGVFAAVILLLVLFSMLHWTFAASLGAAAIPLAVSLLYVFGFRQGNPSRKVAPPAEQGSASKPVELGHEDSTTHHRDHVSRAIHRLRRN